MDKNNRKLKILYIYKCIKANISAIWQHNLCCTYHQLKYSYPNRSKNKTKQEPHKRAYLSENGGLRKRSQENGPKAEKNKIE